MGAVPAWLGVIETGISTLSWPETVIEFLSSVVVAPPPAIPTRRLPFGQHDPSISIT
jgi:hypothetical protein